VCCHVGRTIEKAGGRCWWHSHCHGGPAALNSTSHAHSQGTCSCPALCIRLLSLFCCREDGFWNRHQHGAADAADRAGFRPGRGTEAAAAAAGDGAHEKGLPQNALGKVWAGTGSGEDMATRFLGGGDVVCCSISFVGGWELFATAASWGRSFYFGAIKLVTAAAGGGGQAERMPQNVVGKAHGQSCVKLGTQDVGMIKRHCRCCRGAHHARAHMPAC
jgi:hypothetical protein